MQPDQEPTKPSRGAGLGASDGAHAVLGGAKGTDPLAVWVLVVDGEDKEDAADEEIPVEIGLPLGPVAEHQLGDVGEGDRAVVDESEDD